MTIRHRLRRMSTALGTLWDRYYATRIGPGASGLHPADTARLGLLLGPTGTMREHG
ncbi:hypothetical protein [Nocardia alni]|uniref:hypothetical protein n=1 Tax=Nocardia alni TaxID=2815723 RepID=UPI001C24C97F|nr:hypothetical protein [Nocardia alni]